MSSILLRTEVPGPRSRALLESASEVVARPVTPGGNIFISTGDGAVVEDVDGNRYIDFVGGVGCLIVGHRHPSVVSAIGQQTAAFTHTDFSLLPYEVYTRYARRLAEACGEGLKVALFNTGAEAVENSVKIARKATGRAGIICFEGAFHGRTLLALSLTHREAPYKQGFGPFVPEVYRAPYPGFRGATLQGSLAEVERLINAHEVAAVIVEPVLGEGGFVVPPSEFLGALSTICESAGSVLIADEVQTSFGRTGAFLASQLVGARPGIMILGKSIAAGLPLSALVGEQRWMDALSPNDLGGTYPGNPVACSAALAVLDIIESEGLVQRAEAIGKLLLETWQRIASSVTEIAEVRGVGAMIGVEFSRPETTRAVIESARRQGLLMMSAGPRGEVIRHLMPLVITDDQLEEAFEVLARVVPIAVREI